MNIIHSHPLDLLGYNFIEKEYLPEGKNEYYLRDLQNASLKQGAHRALTTPEIEILVTNRNTSDNWNMIQVTDEFDPKLVRNCKFFGFNRVGNLTPLYREFHNLRMAVGLYNSTIISCDIGNNVCIDNVNYLSHYIIGNDVMITNVNELAATDNAKFGNGIIKQGEQNKNRVWIEVCNENAGRGIIPFDGMLPGDAYLWSRNRHDEKLQEQLKVITEKKFDTSRGYYGTVGDRTVIKNCRIIKDTKIGSDAYIKGANKLKNLTINSDANRKSQIGEGCELVNGIIGYGCRIFYGVKAVRFHMASHSQLKYGARLINSYLGNNSTISCCEVLNSLIFPSHEQHHNNSFLCAALIMGQSNIAAGATIGSNHNSRGADGEIIAGRGFWPGLCVSLKHNSKFASFTILAKGDYPAELNIKLPFSLVTNNVSKDCLEIMPGYWFMYNMYALARNAGKYDIRDQRTEKIQLIEYNYLAPDTINEMFDAIDYLAQLDVNEKGNALGTGFENSNRPTVIIKSAEAIAVFKKMIRYYGIATLIAHFVKNKFDSFDAFKNSLLVLPERTKWMNIGGQLITELAVQELMQSIRNGTVNSWEEIHTFYQQQGKLYNSHQTNHAFKSLLEITSVTESAFDAKFFTLLLQEAIETKMWMCDHIYQSRAKDYKSSFRKMVYENEEEMNAVIGKLEDNIFVQEQYKEAAELKNRIAVISEYCK